MPVNSALHYIHDMSNMWTNFMRAKCTVVHSSEFWGHGPCPYRVPMSPTEAIYRRVT